MGQTCRDGPQSSMPFSESAIESQTSDLIVAWGCGQIDTTVDETSDNTVAFRI